MKLVHALCRMLHLSKRKCFVTFFILMLLVHIFSFSSNILTTASVYFSANLIETFIDTSHDTLTDGDNRFLFYSQYRYWVFHGLNNVEYANTWTDIVYTSSTDGVTWESDSASVFSINRGLYGSSHTDGNTMECVDIHVVDEYVYVTYAKYYQNGGVGGEIHFVRGQFNTGGTISWGYDYIVKSLNSNNAHDPVITVDSNGYPWIAWSYTRWLGGYSYKYNDIELAHSLTNDGTWINDVSANQNLYPDFGAYPKLEAFDDGRVMLLMVEDIGSAGNIFYRIYSNALNNYTETDYAVAGGAYANSAYYGSMSVSTPSVYDHYNDIVYFTYGSDFVSIGVPLTRNLMSFDTNTDTWAYVCELPPTLYNVAQNIGCYENGTVVVGWRSGSSGSYSISLGVINDETYSFLGGVSSVYYRISEASISLMSNSLDGIYGFVFETSNTYDYYSVYSLRFCGYEVESEEPLPPQPPPTVSLIDYIDSSYVYSNYTDTYETSVWYKIADYSYLVGTISPVDTYGGPYWIDKGVVIDTNYTLHCVFGTLYDSDYDVWYSQSTDYGYTWTTPAEIYSGDDLIHYYFTIHCDNEGTLWLVAKKSTASNRSYIGYRNSNGEWSTLVASPELEYGGYVSSICSDSNGIIHVSVESYEDDYYAHVSYMNYSIANGWSSPIFIDTDGGFEQLLHAHIDSDDDDNIWLVYGGAFDDSNFYVKYTTITNGIPSAPTTLFSDSSHQVSDIGMFSFGHSGLNLKVGVSVVLYNATLETTEIYYTEYDGSWSDFEYVSGLNTHNYEIAAQISYDWSTSYAYIVSMLYTGSVHETAVSNHTYPYTASFVVPDITTMDYDIREGNDGAAGSVSLLLDEGETNRLDTTIALASGSGTWGDTVSCTVTSDASWTYTIDSTFVYSYSGDGSYEWFNTTFYNSGDDGIQFALGINDGDPLDVLYVFTYTDSAISGEPLITFIGDFQPYTFIFTYDATTDTLSLSLSWYTALDLSTGEGYAIKSVSVLWDRWDVFQQAVEEEEDTTPPTYSDLLLYPTPVVGGDTNASIVMYDETSLDSPGAYLFWTNSTGEWIRTLAYMSGVEYAVNIGLNTTLLVGNDVIAYYWEFTDHAGNYNTTGLQTQIVQGINVGDIGLELPFDNETSTIAYDWSGYNNHGIISGATRSYNGHYGMSLSFSTDDYVTVVDDYSLDYESSITLSLWIKPTSITESILIDKPNSYGLFLRSNGGLAFMINDVLFNTSTTPISAGNWYHIVAEYTGTTEKIYVNETAVYSETDYSEAIVPSAFDLIIGNLFVGILDEIVISGSTPAALLDAIATYPYVYNSYIDTTACSWLVSTLNYNFTNVYVRQNSSYPLTYVKFNFTDTASEMGLEWSSGTYTEYAGSTPNGTQKMFFISKNYTTSNNAGILWATVRIQDVVQSVANVDIYLYCRDSLDREGELTILSRFSIYGIGGSITYEFAGDGSPILGGSVLDVMATNSSLTSDGSYAITSTVAPNFQHVHQLVHVYQDTFWDTDNWNEPSAQHETAWFAFGVNYMFANCTWTTGWYVNITVTDGQADASNGWVQLTCDWYNGGSFIKSDVIYAMYEAYTEDDTTTQFSLWIDLWISQDFSSSMVGGHVSSVYYGMEQSGWWLWSTWGPVGGLATSSTFYDYLYDENGDLTTAADLTIFHVWNEIAKVAPGVDSYSDACTWALQSEILQIVTLPPTAILSGIVSPVFQPATTPDMPVGFFASLGNSLADILNQIRYALTSVAQGVSTVTVDVLDSVFAAVGLPTFVADTTDFLGTLAAYVTQSFSYITGLIVSFFTLLASIGTFLIEWFGGFISMLITIGAGVADILSGNATWMEAFNLEVLGQFWSMFGEIFASGFVFIILIVFWFSSIDSRAKQTGGGWMGVFMFDVQSIISVFSFILDLAWRVVNTVIDLTMRFINVFI